MWLFFHALTIKPSVGLDAAKLQCLCGVVHGPKCNVKDIQRKNTGFSQIYHQNPAHLCVPYVWLLRDTKCFLENFINKKWRMWRIASKTTNGGRDICLEIDQQPCLASRTPRVVVPTRATCFIRDTLSSFTHRPMSVVFAYGDFRWK